MVRRYPCQIAIVFVLGICLAKAVTQKEYLFAAAILAAALCTIGLWASREMVQRLKWIQLSILAFVFALGFTRMQIAAAVLENRLDGLEDGAAASIQGRVVKKQFKDTGQKAQWVVYLEDSYLKFENQKFENQKFRIKNSNLSNQKKFSAQEIFFHQKLESKQASQLNQDVESKQKYQLHLLSFSSRADGIRPVGKMIVYIGSKEPVIGNTVVAAGKIKRFSSARNEGNFDESSYYQNQGFTSKFFVRDGYQVVNAQKNGFLESCYQMQQKLFTVYTNVMPENEAGVLSAMLLGEKSVLSEETKNLYQQSGIAHILAISGLHISILGAAIYRLLRKLGTSYPISSMASMALLLAFGCMTGMGLSTMRAVIMFGIYLGAACCGRVYDSINGLAIAAACLLLQNPCAIFLAGFQFSFAAILGVLFGQEICRIFQPRLRIAETVFTSFGIQLLTLPLTAWYYFEIPLYSILLNIVVLPFMEAALLAGLLGGGFGLLAGWIGGEAGFFAGLAGLPSRALLGFCTVLLKFFSKSGGLSLKLPGALYAVGRPYIWQMAGYYVLFAVCFFLIFHSKMMQDKETEKQKKKQFLRRQKQTLCAGSIVCLSLLFLRLPKQAEVDVLDVGQGDGIYIHTSDGLDVLIDGGSTDVSKVGVYRILPYLKSKGVNRVDDWFVSHLDKDHISGLEELVERGFSIGQVIFAEGVLEDEAYEKLSRKLAQFKVQVRQLAKGDALRGANSRFLCLAPGKDDTADDRNARSMVLLYEDTGFSAFFSGDISQNEEAKLLEEGRLPYATFYKAAHHGSNSSNSIEILNKLAPLVSVVSCAKENDYGHPGKEAVGHMEKASQSVYYTMKGGRIQIGWGKGKVWVREFCNENGQAILQSNLK